MIWIHTHKIQVPANSNQITEVAINEWFHENPRFLLGRPIANQLRGSNNGWAQTVAIQSDSDREFTPELRLALRSILMRTNVNVERKAIAVQIKLEETNKYQAVTIDADVYDGVLAIHQPVKAEEEERIITHVNTGAKLPNEGTFSYQECRDRVYDLLALPIAWNSTGFPEMSDEVKGKVREIMRADYLSKNLRDRLLGEESIALPAPEDKQLSQANNEGNMASKIPADKFEQASGYSFILRENPKQKRIEIHFPEDAAPKPDMISQLAKHGFEKAKSNPHLWYAPYSDELMAKARGWVTRCAKYGAYELDSSVPVEQTKSRRRSPSKPAEKTEAPAAAPPNKLVDAVALRVREMLEEMLPGIIEQVAGSSQELNQLKAENLHLKETIAKQEVVVEEQKQIIQEGMSQLIEVAMERDRLRSQLAEWGVVESEPEEESPMFDDDDEPSVFADEPEEESVFADEEPPVNEEGEEEGLDFDALGE